MKEVNNDTNTSDSIRVEKGNFLEVDSKKLRDDISMANTEAVDNVAEWRKRQIEEQLCAVFEEAKSKLDNIDARAKNEKKQVIIQLAKDLEGKVPTDTISIEIVNQLRGIVSERFIHESLDDKYKQKYRAENAKKRKSKEEEKGNEENLAAVALLNRETKRKVTIIIDNQGRLEIVEDEKSPDQHASDNVAEDTGITTAKAHSLQRAVRQEREVSQPEALARQNYQENQDIESHGDETKCPEQIKQQQGYEEWSQTKFFELQNNAIPLKITVNSVKREIVSIE
ncbi:MAG: hypothetical protein ACJ71P_12135, partial [Nitrososphaeraceae archaeon]